MCRFISADGYVQTGQNMVDKNMFAYCLNNPVNMSDKSGKIAGWAIALGVIAVCAIIGGIIGGLRTTNAYKRAYSNSNSNNNNNKQQQ